MHRTNFVYFTTHDRYSFNGMSKVDELKGDGNSYTTEFRQYDPRIGRWLSLDPLTAQFPWQSPYCAFDNNPLNIVDPTGENGEEPKIIYVGSAKSKIHPQEAEKVITDIMKTVGLLSVTVGSLQRSPEQQAKVMLIDLKNGKPDNYSIAGTKVQNVYYNLKKQGKNESEILDAMINEVYKQGPEKVSKHCADPSKIIVFDISLTSIPLDKKLAFISAVKNAQANGLIRENGFQHPGNNPNENAYHIEVPLNNNSLMNENKNSQTQDFEVVIYPEMKKLNPIPVSNIPINDTLIKN